MRRAWMLVSAGCVVAATAAAGHAPQATTAAAGQAPPATTAAATPDPVRMAAARRLIDTILPPATRDATLAQMVTVLMGNMTRGIVQGQGLEQVFAEHPDAARVFARFVDRQRQIALDDLKQATPALIEAEAAAYARRFTLEEMAAVQAFFASPTGQKYRVESATLMNDPAVAAWQSDLAARSQARLRPGLSKLMEQLTPIIRRDAADARGKHS